ncbi:hypothetical protein [Microcoleus sp. D2_18a_D3]|uniref:hypothetical protein n=1 Tax=Microcoleus sp. D2_18a_D3 TaxID=3055330 RepID=UPI002FD680C3
MKGFTPEQLLAICEYFREPDCNQPHGEIVATQLLSAMIGSGKYELEEYPRLAEAAVKLTVILAARFHDELKRGEVEESAGPSLQSPKKILRILTLRLTMILSLSSV